MSQPGGAYAQSGTGYRYGFNGQEKSEEIKGAENSYTAEFWEYDPRAGRRWNLDPKPTVGISGYSAFNSSPLWYSDPLGDWMHVALGVREHLAEFAKLVKGVTWEKWGTKDFQSQFMDVINNPVNKIHFNLDGVGNEPLFM